MHTDTDTDTEPEAPTAYQLAYEADCSSPDSPTSPGAVFLHTVYTAAREALTYNPDEPHDATHEVADSCVPIYTHDIWRVFTDLAAYQTDTDDYGPFTDLTAAATAALYAIGYRLAAHVLTDTDA